MSDDTPLLSLPLILPSQAQKHVTHNEALRLLDVLVQLAVTDRTRTAPPAAPVEGDRHLVAAGATGDWAGRSGQIAAFWGGAWMYLVPRPGWTLHVIAEGQSLTYSGHDWITGDATAERVDRLGIGTVADAVNRLSVEASATLLSHDGAGHQAKINKADAAQTASLLFQTGFQGRAEIGTLGEDALSVKVSTDGVGFVTALRAVPATARIELPQGATVSGSLDGTAVTQSQSDGVAGRLLKNFDHGIGAQGATEVQVIANLDDLGLRTGFFATAGGTTGTFPAGAGPTGCGWISRSDAAGGAMLFMDAGSDALWTRRFTQEAGFAPWRRLYGTQNILAPVAQSGGQPTGGVIERIVTASGSCTRFADGTQLCTHGMTASSTGLATWTFPAAFAAPPVVVASAVGTTCLAAMLTAATTGAVSFNVLNTSNARQAVPVGLSASGRWF